jgi:hypothetical protein
VVDQLFYRDKRLRRAFARPFPRQICFADVRCLVHRFLRGRLEGLPLVSKILRFDKLAILLARGETALVGYDHFSLYWLDDFTEKSR